MESEFTAWNKEGREGEGKMEKIVPIIDIPYNKIAKRVVACGDPARAEKIAGRLENVETVAKSREYWTFNGTYKGVPVTVSSHGVGGNGASVSFEGLILGGAKVIIRVGTCGTLQKDMDQGALIIATAACRDDGITSQFIPLSYPAVASMDVVGAMQKAADELNLDTRTGTITVCSQRRGFWPWKMRLPYFLLLHL